MQAMGFAWTGVLFMLCAVFYRQLTQQRLIPVFRLMYYMSRCRLCAQGFMTSAI